MNLKISYSFSTNKSWMDFFFNSKFNTLFLSKYVYTNATNGYVRLISLVLEKLFLHIIKIILQFKKISILHLQISIDVTAVLFLI